MIPALSRFIGALRAEGVDCSPAEAVDAARALELTGMERRESVRRALAATLAKDRKSRAAFDRVFDRFFSAPRTKAAGRGAGRPGARREDPKPKRPHEPAGDPKRRPSPPREEEEPKRRGKAPRPGRLRKIVREDRPRDPSPSRDPRRRELARRMTTDEERQVAAEVPRVVEALRLKPGRRRVEARAGRPWLRKALRRATATGGVPFVLPAQVPKRRTAKVVLLVDVSFSVARAAGLFLLIASAFVEIGRRARVLCFVDRPVDATDAIARWSRGRARVAPAPGPARPGRGVARRGVAFADVLEAIPGLNLQAPSDYGRAIHALRSLRRGVRGRDTLLVVLGDARANRFDPLPWALEEVRAGCGGVIWLVPEPAARWGTGDSALREYMPSIDVLVEAVDLQGLATGVAEMRRRL